MLLELLWKHVLLCNLQLFFVRIAAKLNNLHAVAQRLRNGIQRVRRGNKQNIGQIKGQLDKMIAKRHVLLGVEHLQQSRGGISFEIIAELVDFINQHQAIAAARLLQRSDDTAGHRTDIGAAMTANIGFVAHATQRKPRIIAPHAPRNRARDRRFSNTRRAYQANNLSFDPTRQLLYGKKL